MSPSSRQEILDAVLDSSFVPEVLALDLVKFPPRELRKILLSLLRTLKSRGVLLDLAIELSGQVDIGALAMTAAPSIARLLGANRARLYLVDSSRKTLWTREPDGSERKVPFPEEYHVDGHTMGKRDPESTLSVPIRDGAAQVLGVIEATDCLDGEFSDQDRDLAANIAFVVGSSVQSANLHEKVRERQRQLESLLNVANAMTSKLELTSLIETIMAKASEILDADRSTLFLLDRTKKELWSKVAQGVDGASEIRFPADRGIAGHVVTRGETLNIEDAYEEALFNREIDRKTGYRTRTILCTPIRNTHGETMGVTQVINKRDGAFTPGDEQLLSAFSVQAAIALENAQLYERTLHLKNYLESILQNLSNGVITIDTEGRVTTLNEAAQRILEIPATGVGQPIEDLFAERSAQIVERFRRVLADGVRVTEYDADHISARGRPVSLNITVDPLVEPSTGKRLGALAVIEDMTREKRQRSMLSRLISKDVAERVLGEDFGDLIKGNMLEVTVLFSDIRSFTSITETNSAVEIVELLNEYFGEMVDAILGNGGTLDKYIGDAIMAIFGAPIPDGANPARAITAALQMQKDLARFNVRREERNLFPIRIGIGLATGEVLCGMIGSQKKMEYTAIGDAVNLSSRLESANKVYGTTIILADSTLGRIQPEPQVRRLDRVRVKGKDQATTIYELLGLPGEALPDRVAEHRDLFEAGVTRVTEARDLKAARRFLDDALRLAPEDRATRLWLDRVRAMEETPPPEDWDGTFQFTEK